MTRFADLSPTLRAARDAHFVREMTRTPYSLIAQAHAESKARYDALSPYEKMILDLDSQHADVRHAYAVLLGEGDDE